MILNVFLHFLIFNQLNPSNPFSQNIRLVNSFYTGIELELFRTSSIGLNLKIVK